MPKTKEIEVWLHKHINFGHEAVFTFEKIDGYITLGTGTAVFEIIEQDETALVVDALNIQKQKILADCEVSVERIEDKIQQLLAIEDKSNA